MRSKTDIRGIWTPGRVIALLAIAGALGALAHFGLAHPAGWASVPPGARAGQLTLHPCTYPTEAGRVAADCGTLVVPEDRHDARSRLIALPVIRIRARSGRPAEPIFRLEGGPGRSNLDFPFASRYTADHDLVLVGYRGVDGSVRLDCPEVTDARRDTADMLGADALRAAGDAFRRCAQRLQADGHELAGYTMAERVDDFEAARRALGYRRVDLLSESFGTRLALVYAERHPGSIRRSVMVDVNPPGHFVYRPAQTKAQLGRFAAQPGSRGVPAMSRPLPRRWGPFPIHAGNARVAAFFGLMDASSAASPISAPMTLDAWDAAARGDASGVWFESLAAALLLPRAQVWGDAASVGRADFATVARYFAEPHPPLGDAANRLVWAGGALTNAWPADPDDAAYSRVRDSAVPTLLVGGTLDGATPAENATRELLPHLRNGHQVVLAGFGHTTDFWNRQVAAGDRLVNTYFDSGRVDASGYVPERVDFTPPLTQTTLAKEVVAGLAGLALFALFSLAGLAWRVARRGRLGRVTQVAARSAWAALIGLGGWAATALLALIVLPSVPLDAELLLIASMGVPVALASWLGWRGPERVAKPAAALAAGVLGALAGAWFGYHCGAAPMTVVTTLVGAVAGANLVLVALDLAYAARAARTARALAYA